MLELNEHQISRPTGKPRGVCLGFDPHKPLPMEKRKEDFWKMVKKAGEDECWEWRMKPDPKNGYGRFCWNAKPRWAHRFSWMIHNGEIPKGKCVMHSCDNRICVNPKHLSVGTLADNNRDMFRKGRGSKPPSSATITEQQVLQIRRMFREQCLKMVQISKLLKVSYRAVESALNKNRWRQVPWN